MGKYASKPTKPSFSQRLHYHLLADAEYRRMNAGSRHKFRQAVLRELDMTASRVAFVRPVLEFIPRPVQLQRLRLFPEIAQPVIERVPDQSRPYTEMVFTPARPRLPKPNKRRRKLARQIRIDRERIDIVPTHQMIRRIQINSLAARFDFISNLALTVTSIIDVLGAFITWMYYSVTSESQWAMLSRVSSYFGRIRTQDGEMFSELLHDLEHSRLTLFGTFVYLSIRQRHIRPSYVQYQQAVTSFFANEGLRLEMFRESELTMRPFWEYEPVLDCIYQREKERFLNMIYIDVGRELTKLRGLRLFHNVLNTVMTIPIVGLAVSASRLPASSMAVVMALRRLTSPLGSDQFTYSVIAQNGRPLTFESFVEGLDEVTDMMDIRSNVDSLMRRAQRAVLRRRNRQVPDEETNRFEEL